MIHRLILKADPREDEETGRLENFARGEGVFLSVQACQGPIYRGIAEFPRYPQAYKRAAKRTGRRRGASERRRVERGEIKYLRGGGVNEVSRCHRQD
jgi:hypothetical protein